MPVKGVLFPVLNQRFPLSSRSKSSIIRTVGSRALEPTVLIIDDFDLEERGNLWFRTGNKTPFTGKAKRSYPSGKTLLEIPYLNGKKHGTQIIWEESGKVLRKIEWKNNQRSK